MKITLCLLVVFLCVLCTCSQEQEITVPLKFGEADLQLSFPANKNAALTMAEKFCTEKAMVDSTQMDSCLETVGEYLSSAVEKHHQSTKKRSTPPEAPKEHILTISLQIGSNVYDIEYKHEIESSLDVASLFCKQNMKALGISYSTMNSCVEPVLAQLDSALEKHLISSGLPIPKKKVVSKERKITLDIGGVNYDLTIDPSKETIEESAAKFCLSKLETFDLTEDNMKEYCADLIVDYIKNIL